MFMLPEFEPMILINSLRCSTIIVLMGLNFAIWGKINPKSTYFKIGMDYALSATLHVKSMIIFMNRSFKVNIWVILVYLGRFY
jgi:hypothetical protein